MKTHGSSLYMVRFSEDEKAIILLKKWLSAQQRDYFDKLGWFLVVGEHTGHVYCVCMGSIYVVRVTGKRLAFGLYLMDHPNGDMALAQKLIVETNEKFMLTHACRAEVF